MEQSRVPLPNRVRDFEIPYMARCRYSNREIKVRDYENREPEENCFDYGLLTHISEIKNNVGVDTCIVPKMSCYNMQKHEDRYQLWRHALAICGLDKVAFSLRNSIFKPGQVLSGTPVLNVSAYIQKLPNIT